MARKKNGILSVLQSVIFCFLYLSPAFSQPIPFDKKYSDSILPSLSTVAADCITVNHLLTLPRMYFNVNGNTAISFAVEAERLAKKAGYGKGVINSLKQQAFQSNSIYSPYYGKRQWVRNS